jgi:phosphoribosyl-ATP pyrophosphohydrolase
MRQHLLEQLSQVIEQRITSGDPQSSYVAQLHHQGINKMLEKVIEETGELVIAAKDAQVSGDNTQLVSEIADTFFHILVLLPALDLSLDDICHELEKRFNLSGLAEKASRTSTNKS